VFEQIRQVVLSSGVWNGKQAETHKFVLTPSVYELSVARAAELRALTHAIAVALKEIDQLMVVQVHPALRAHIPTIDLDLLDVEPGVGPGIFKFDVIEGVDGRWYVPEIDTRVIQNWGVGILTERIRQVVMPCAEAISDMVGGVAREFHRMGGDGTLYLIYPDVERFYKPYFLVVKAVLAEFNIQLEVIHENRGEQAAREGKFFVDLPLCRFNHEVGVVLARRYRAGEVRFLVPPKSHLGSKNVLSLLYGAGKLEPYLPESRLVYDEKTWEGVGTQFILKEVISGGSKGLTFGDTAEFAARAQQARREPYRFMLQREIQTLARTLPYFGPEGDLREGIFAVRLIVHANGAGEVFDVQATACQNTRIIHGGKDALMFGAAIT
jgi:hypothetical protein